MNFEDAKEKILKHGVLDITMQDDNTWMSFILADGTSVNVYTTEIVVPINDDNGDEMGESYEQSEMLFFDGDLS
jgi:hypothetical protein